MSVDEQIAAPPLPVVAAIVRAVAGLIIEVELPDGRCVSCGRVKGLPPVQPGNAVLILSLPDRHLVTAVIDDGSPDELVIEAGRQLTIRCGAGSLTIRHDGRVLIKGLDIVTRASRANRIKGGQVVVN